VQFQELHRSSVSQCLKTFLAVLGFVAFSTGISSAQVSLSGSETKANGTTSNRQLRPAVAQDSSGKFVIAWESEGTDGDGFGIYARRFTSAGASSGAQFIVNTTTAGEQRFPAIASNDSGAFVVVWMDETQDGSGNGWGVYAQRFDNTGAAQGSEFVVSSNVTEHQKQPAVAMDAAGNFVVVWQRVTLDGSSFRIRGRRFDSSGNPLASLFNLSGSSSSYRGNPVIAMENDGAFAVAWQAFGTDNSGMAIRARAYDASHSALASNFAVNTDTTGNQQEPAIGIDSTGAFVVAWSSYAQDGDAEGVFAQRYNNDGTVNGSEFHVSTTTAGAQENPWVAMTLSGSFSVVWSSYGQDGSFTGTYLQAFDNTGDTVGTETIINTRTTDFQDFPAAAQYSSSQQLVVAWNDGLRNSNSTNDGDDYGIYFQRVDIPQTLSLSMAADSAACNGESSGSAWVTVSGGTTPYTYAWSTGSTNDTIFNVAAGTYLVTVTDAGSLSSIDSVTVGEPGSLSIAITTDSNVSCNGFADGGATASATGGTGIYTYTWSNSATMASVTGVAAGTYIVTVTDANGCTDSTFGIITEPASLVASTIVDSNVSCNGFADGGATASATGGTGVYTYAWSNAATTASITGVIAGTYSVTVTDANGCTDSASVVITEPVTLVSSSIVDSTVSCGGLSDGGATASGAGGTGVYTYTWSNTATTAGITGVIAGTYSVTVTDANGCTDSSSITITEPPTLVAATVVDSNTSCNTFADGGATSSATGGTGVYTYTWSNSATTASITGVMAGTYSVTVTDANGCTDSTTVTITEPALLVAATVVDSNVTCNGASDGGATASATGGTMAYTYTWSNTATTQSITGVMAGTYSVTVTDANGCTDSTSVTITEPASLIAATAVDSNVSCNGFADGGATASATNGTMPYTYTWSNTATTASITGVVAGTYSVTVTDANGCTDSTSVTITEPTTLVAATVVDSTVSCGGFSDGGATASGTGGTGAYTYTWSNSATTASITGVVAGTYSVTVTDNNGCTDSASVVLTEPAILFAIAAVSSPISCFGFMDGQIITAPETGGTLPYTYTWSNSATTASITGVIAGAYSVTVTDANGCTDSTTVTITDPALLVSATVVDSNVSCNGASDGGATASATGGTMAYTYTWSNTATTQSITGVMAGTYSVTITDANGCTDSTSVVITEPIALVAATVVDSNASCNGFADGGATASATNGTTPYTFTWSNSATTASITGVIAGTYSVTVTDANGCTDSTSVVITEPFTLVAATAVDSTVSCGGLSDGGATASGTGGTGVYTYTWSNSATTQSITGVVAGTYSVTVTDANGCTDSSSVTITEPPTLVAATAVDSNVTCNTLSDGGATASATGGTGVYTYTWSNSATTASITGVIAGAYSVTVTDANGCTDSTTVTITEPALLVSATVVDSNVSCNGASDGGATASATGGTMAYTYTWSNTATTQSITGVMAGTYSVTITDANGCTDSTSVVITEPIALVAATVVDSNASCNGFADGGATASATNGTTPYTFTWSNSATTASITGVIAGTYSVTVTDANGCTDSTSVVITEPFTLVAATAVDSTVSCGGLSDGGATASGTGGTGVYTYTWSNSATTQSITGVVAGTYSVTVTDANGCTDSSSVTITEPPTLVAATAVDSNVTCNTLSDGGATASATGGTGVYTYTWSNSATTASITGVIAGTYSVTVTDANGCTDSTTVTIAEPALLVAATVVDSNVTCNGASDGGATASGTGGTMAYTYTWSNSATTQSITGVLAGTYSVTVTDANGCTDSTSVTITEPIALVAATAVDSNASCNGFADGGATASATNGTTPYTFTWSNTATTASITGVVAGTYSVTVTDANGCTDSTSVVITEPVTLLAATTVDSTVSCGGLSDGGATASGTGGTGVYTYTWSNSATTQSITGVVAGTYSVTVTDANGCTDSSSVTITEPPTLVAATAVDSNASCNTFSDGGATASATGGTGVYTYTWSNTATTQSITGVIAGTYSVTVTDANGCTDSTTVTITEPATLVAATVVDSNVSCNGASDGGATASGTGGTMAYTYTWSNSATTASITGVIAGTYSVTVTDANGCTDSTSVTITEPIALVAATAVDSNASCNGFADGGATASGTNGTTPYTFTWSNSATTQSITGVIAGTYSVTVTDVNGCTDSASVVMTEPVTLVSSSIVDSTVSCGGLSDGGATASGTGGTGVYTYTWSNSATTQSITGVVAGTYSVTVTDANGCTDSSSVTITEPPTLVAATVVDSNVTCNTLSDGGATASATGGTGVYTYSWSNSATTAGITGVIAGTYSVTVTDANGCTDSTTVIITEPATLVAATVVDSNVSCNGLADGGATASGTGGTLTYIYTWSNSATTASITGVIAGTYSVTVTDANGCTDSTSVTITEPIALVAATAVDSNASCNGFADGGATASATNGTTPYTFIWSNSATTQSITGVVAGTYSVTVTDANGCTDSASVVITEPVTLVSSSIVDSTVSCGGLSDGGATANGTGGTGAYTYTWSNSATTQSITGVVAGTYSVTVTDANGCTDSSSVTITEPPTLVAATVVDSNVTCNTLSDGGATASATGGTGVYTYSWSNSATTAGITGVIAGTYSVTVTDANGCTDSTTVTITEPALLVAATVVDSNVTCNGASDGGATASATGGIMAYTYTWSNTATTQSITGVMAGTYSVTITDANGCTDSSSVTITEPPTLVATTAVDSNVSCNMFSDGGATASGTSGTTPYTFTWSNSATTASITGVIAGTYSVTVTDANGCTDSTSVTITEPATLSIIASLDSNENCVGSLDGGASTVTGGGTTAYTYSWSNGATTAPLTGVGAGTYSVTVTDANGCTDSASVSIIVLDVTPPVAIAQNLTVYLDANGQTTITANDVDNGSNDNCGTVVLSIDMANFSCANLGSPVTVTLTAADLNGNMDTATAVVTVLDTVSPTAIAQNLTVYLDANGQTSITANDINNGSYDSCGVGIIIIDTANFDCANTTAPVTVTLTVTDVNGNVDTATATVTVLDTVSPVAIAQNLIVYLGANGLTSITANDVDNGSNDSCGIASLAIDTANFDCANVGSSVTVILTVTDMNNNESTATSTVTVLDTVSPIVIAQNLTVQLDANGQATITANDLDNGSSDSCGIASLTIDTANFDCGNVGTPITVTLTVTDVNTNVSTATATITVMDTVSPIAIAQPLTVYLDANGMVSITANDINNGSNDSCSIASLAIDTANFTCANVGSPVTVTLTATDVNNNIGTATSIVTVLDTVSPVAMAQNLTVYLDSFGVVSITADSVNSGSYDSCGVSLSIDTANFSCANVGAPLTVTLIVTDASGNASTAISTVTVLDTIAPTVLTQNISVYLDGAGLTSITPNDVNNGTWDSCGVVNLVIDTSNFDCANVGVPVTVTLTATDVNGNIDSTTAIVTVLDTVNPTISCPVDIVTSNDSAQCGAIIGFNYSTATENCGIDSIIQIDTTGLDSASFFPIGVTTLEYVAYDPSGNTDTCSFTVTVLDTTAPAIVCPSDTVICDSVLNYPLVTSVDNCPGETIVQIAGLPSGSTFPLGSTVNTFVASDTSGNTDTCSFMVTRDAAPTTAMAGSDAALCDQTTYTLAGNTPVTGTGIWNVLTGSASITDTVNPASPVTALMTGTNEFVWTISNGVCLASVDTVAISVDELPTVANAGIDQSLCDAGSIALGANVPVVGTGTWTIILGAGVVGDIKDPGATVSNLSIDENVLVWTISNGVCASSIDTVLIDDNELPTVEAQLQGGFVNVAFPGLNIPLEATTTLADTYLWSPEESLDDATIPNPVANVRGTTVYSVTVTSEEGCTATDEVTINASDRSSLVTGITPNGDGKNDVWNIPELRNYPECVVEIRERNGGLMFSSTGYAEPWDGKFNGQTVPVASYYFVIDLKDGINEPFTGIVTVIR